MVCRATPEAHCCWIGNGQVCPFFDPAGLVDGRDGGCTLRQELGSWKKVQRDPRYRATVQATIPHFNSRVHCGNYPKDTTCGECGESG